MQPIHRLCFLALCLIAILWLAGPLKAADKTNNPPLLTLNGEAIPLGGVQGVLYQATLEKERLAVWVRYDSQHITLQFKQNDVARVTASGKALFVVPIKNGVGQARLELYRTSPQPAASDRGVMPPVIRRNLEISETLWLEARGLPHAAP